MTSISAALTTDTHDRLVSHLLRADGQEDLAFITWHPSRGRARDTALIDEVILPQAGERHVHGNAAFEPTYFLRALLRAHERGAGLGLIHSHPAGVGWQGIAQTTITPKPGTPRRRRPSPAGP